MERALEWQLVVIDKKDLIQNISQHKIELLLWQKVYSM